MEQVINEVSKLSIAETQNKIKESCALIHVLKAIEDNNYTSFTFAVELWKRANFEPCHYVNQFFVWSKPDANRSIGLNVMDAPEVLVSLTTTDVKSHIYRGMNCDAIETLTAEEAYHRYNDGT